MVREFSLYNNLASLKSFQWTCFKGPVASAVERVGDGIVKQKMGLVHNLINTIWTAEADSVSHEGSPMLGYKHRVQSCPSLQAVSPQVT